MTINLESCRAHSRALLLIDFQHDFLSENGLMPVLRYHVEPAILATRTAIENARVAGELVVAIGNEFRPNDYIMNLLRRGAAIAGSAGAAWDKRVWTENMVYLPKWRSDAFTNPALGELLERHAVGEVTLTGLFARACVSATAKSALARGLRVHILAPAVACASDRSREAALKRLRRRGAVVSGVYVSEQGRNVTGCAE